MSSQHRPGAVYAQLVQRFLGWNHVDTCAAALPLPLAGRAIAYEDFRYGNCSLLSSCPALGRASTSHFVPARKTWMAGTSPAMTMPKQRLHSGHSLYAIALPASGRGSERPTLVAGSDWFHGIDHLIRDGRGQLSASVVTTTRAGADGSCKLREVAIVRLICPDVSKRIRCRYYYTSTLHGVVFDISWWGRCLAEAREAPARLRPAGFGETAFAYRLESGP